MLPHFSDARVLVMGDVMLDRYWHGVTSRISPEAPVPVVHVQQGEERPGGAANVALNIVALGAGATLLGLAGEDEAGQALERRLAASGIDCRIERLAGFATITKLRVLSRHQQLIRLDFEDGFIGYDGLMLRQRFEESLSQAGAVVLSDYAKGSLRGTQTLIHTAREAGKPVLVDPKGRDFAKYRGATVITPNLAEFEAVVGPCESEEVLAEKGEALRYDLGIDALLVTRGEHGMTLLRAAEPPLHLRARAREVYDVTGAGDTVIAVLAASLAARQDLAQATRLANLAAGLVVGKLGAATVSADELRAALQTEPAVSHGMVDEQTLLAAVRQARARGETVVMTNGCFDLLHAGHVQYLAQAHALGDRLIVAVNDDDSVRRLKGPGRPVNPLASRMQVLAALAAVDWVVPFSEDTPERLICRVLPDALVKGGDYRPEQVAGGSCVTARGGRVVVLDFVPGCSTSGMIASIRELPSVGPPSGGQDMASP